MINALVLAAGESRRMGMPKPLLRFGATTFLEQIVGVLRRCECGQDHRGPRVAGRDDPCFGRSVGCGRRHQRELSRRAVVVADCRAQNRGEGVPPLRPAGILPAAGEQGQDARATWRQFSCALSTIRSSRVDVVDSDHRGVPAGRANRLCSRSSTGRRGHPTLFAQSGIR